ncbi:MAG TPA: cupin domain-containing protein [Polyangia bacterium]|jgi:quercetin dioxygenase-like cupin family protein
MKKILTIAIATTLAASAAYAASKPSPRIPAADLKWEQPMGPNSLSLAFVVGDAKSKGRTEFFLKFPGGFESGWHTHDGDYDATVVKGTMTAQAQGDAAETALPPGSFFGEPAKKNHRNSCTKDGECIIFVRAEKGFSFHPMTPEGKPVPAPKADAAKK